MFLNRIRDILISTKLSVFIGKLSFITYIKDIAQVLTGATAWSRVNQVVFISFLGENCFVCILSMIIFCCLWLYLTVFVVVFVVVEKRFYGDVKSDRGSCPRNLFAIANNVEDNNGWASHLAYFSRLLSVGWGHAVDPFWIGRSSFCCLLAVLSPILLDCPGIARVFVSVCG